MDEVKVKLVVRSTTVNSFEETLDASLKGYFKAFLGDRLISMVNQDPSMASFQSDLVGLGKTLPEGIYSQPMVSRQLGGERNTEVSMKQQFKDLVNPFRDSRKLYPKTWEVATNELTWVLRTVDIKPSICVYSDGSIKIEYRLTDKFDLKPDHNDPDYDYVTRILGKVYHGIMKGSALRMAGKWNAFFDKNGKLLAIENLNKPTNESTTDNTLFPKPPTNSAEWLKFIIDLYTTSGMQF